jgi:hypothetical protein
MVRVNSRTSLLVNMSNPNNVPALRCAELQVQTFFKIIAAYRYEKGVGGVPDLSRPAQGQLKGTRSATLSREFFLRLFE